MPVLDVLRDIFGGGKRPTHADALAAIRKQYPMYNGVADDALARAAAQKIPDKFGFLKDFDPKAEIPDEAVPVELRDEGFYKRNPVLGTKDALAFIEQFKAAQPRYKRVEAKKLAAALEKRFPENPRARGLYARLVGTTEEDRGAGGAPKEVPPGAPAKGPTPAQKLYQMGMKSYMLGDEAGALRAWQDVLKMDPALQEARRGVERILLRRKPPEPPKPESLAVYKTGLESFASGRADEAGLAWKRAVELDPNNLAAKRGLERLARMEELKQAAATRPPSPGLPAAGQEPGAAEMAGGALATGGARFMASLARTPNLVYNFAALPVNLARRKAGLPEVRDPALFEDAAKWWDRKAEEADLGARYWRGENLASLVKKKDPKEWGGYLAYKVLENAPQQVMFVGSALAGAPGLGLALAGTTSASQALAEGREKGAGQVSATANAALNGIIEAGFERLGTLSVLRKWGGALTKAMGQKAAQKTIVGMVKNLFSGAVQEGAEEGLTSLGQDFAEVITGVDPKAMKGSVGRAIEATAIGAASSVALTAPAGAVDAASRPRATRETNLPAGEGAPAKAAPATPSPPASPPPLEEHRKTDEPALRPTNPYPPSSREAAIFEAGAAAVETLVGARASGRSAAEAQRLAGESFDRGVDAMERGRTPGAAPTAEEFFTETPEERAARRKRELDIFKKIEVPPTFAGGEETGVPRVEVPREEVLARAQALQEEALGRWEARNTPLERFVVENGGIAIDPAERGEYADVPVRLRAVDDLERRRFGKKPDIMEQMAKEAGVLRPNETLYGALSRLPKRGERPALGDFVEQARRELEYEYEVYGPPNKEEEGGFTGVTEEEIPFEKGPGYGSQRVEAQDLAFSRALDDLKTGKRPDTEMVPLGDTPPALRLAGAEPLPLRISPGVLRKVTEGKRNIPLEEIKRLPARLRDPIMVFRSATQPDSLVALVEMTENGKPVVVAVKLSVKDRRHEINAVASVYGKDRAEVILEWAGKGLLRYVNTEKATAWAQSLGLQLPQEASKPSNKSIATQADLVKEGGAAYGQDKGPARAMFLGYQEGVEGDAPVALYNIRGEHPSTGSTVAAETLRKMNIAVPETPTFEEWKKNRRPAGAADTQGELFGGKAPARAVTGKPKSEAEGQELLFGKMARPQFELPKPGPQGEALAKTEEGKHQVGMRAPEPLLEADVVKDLADQGFLPVPKMRIEGPEDTAAIFHFLKNQTVESFYVLSLDAEGRILGVELNGVGILNATMVHPRDALKGAALLGASEVVFVHNHPSGNPEPSTEDLTLTARLAAAAERIGVRVRHHVVINDTEYGVIEHDGRGFAKSVRKREAAPAGEGGQARLVKPVRSTGVKGQELSTPEEAVEFVKRFQESRRGVVLVALDTRLRANSAWYLGEDYPSALEAAEEVARIALRNNAAGVIFSGPRLPGEAYMRAVQHGVEKEWGVELVDFTAFDGGQVRSAREEKLLKGRLGGGASEAEDAAGSRYVDGQEVAERIYGANRRVQRKGLVERTKTELKEAVEDAKTGFFSKALAPLSKTLKSISPEIMGRMRRLEYDVAQRVREDAAAVRPFLEAVRRLNPEDRADLDLARKNGDGAKIRDIVQRNGLTEEYDALRRTLEAAYDRAQAVGFDLGHRREYHPRKIKDVKGFLREVASTESWSAILQAIKAKEGELRRPLTEEERAQLANAMLRGYGPKISLTETGNMRARKIPQIDALLNKYYYDSDAALVMYLHTVNEAIEARRFFGKGPDGAQPETIEESIGAYTLRLVADGKISPDDEMRLREALQARFRPREMAFWARTYRDLSYLETMGSISSSMTQLEDLALAWYRAGLLGGTVAAVKAATGTAKVTAADLGIDKISQEFRDGREVQGALERVFRLTGLEWFDRLGKNALIEAALRNYQREARAGEPSAASKRRMEALFSGEEADGVWEDLRAGRATEGVKLLLFSDLLEVQPVAKSEMPQAYLEGGNLRLFYMLKSFVIKRVNFFLDETFELMKKPETRREGVQNLFRLTALMVLAGAGADELKDLVFRRYTSWTERLADNLLKLFGFTKFTIYDAKMNGWGQALMRVALPPFKLADAVGRDFKALYGHFREDKDFKGFETAASVPLVGKLYYWWFGRGRERTLERMERARTAPYRDIRKRTLEQMREIRAGRLDWRKLPPEEQADLRKRITRVRAVERGRRRLAELDRRGVKDGRVEAYRQKLREEMASAR